MHLSELLQCPFIHRGSKLATHNCIPQQSSSVAMETARMLGIWIVIKKDKPLHCVLPASSSLILISHQAWNVQPALGMNWIFKSFFLSECWGLGTPHSWAPSSLSLGVHVWDAILYLDINPLITAGQGSALWAQFLSLHPPSSAKSHSSHFYTPSAGKLNFSLHSVLGEYIRFWPQRVYFFLLADCRMWGGLCLMCQVKCLMTSVAKLSLALIWYP